MKSCFFKPLVRTDMPGKDQHLDIISLKLGLDLLCGVFTWGVVSLELHFIVPIFSKSSYGNTLSIRRDTSYISFKLVLRLRVYPPSFLRIWYWILKTHWMFWIAVQMYVYQLTWKRVWYEFSNSDIYHWVQKWYLKWRNLTSKFYCGMYSVYTVNKLMNWFYLMRLY